MMSSESYAEHYLQVMTLEMLSPIAREAAEARSRDGILSVIHKLPLAFGLKHFSLMRAPSLADEHLEHLIIESSHAPAFFREIDRRKVTALSRAYPLLRKISSPLCWSYLGSKGVLENFVVPAPVIDFYLDNEISTSVIVPLHSSDGKLHIMRLDGNRNVLSYSELNELGLLVLQSFMVFDRIRREENLNKSELSPRELDVIRWTARGKTSKEIAIILSLSEYTINSYVINAIRKLDCANRTHLIAKSMRLGLIN